MTAENQGTGTPEGDDPFAYLYRQDGGQEGGQAPQQPGVPRRSYNQVRAVGERQYGRQGAQTPQEAPGPGGGPSAHYAAPETVPGGRAAARSQAAAEGRGRGRGGGNRNGLLIGAIAVVAAVGIGIGSAMYFHDESPADDGPTAAPSADAGGGGEQGDGSDQGDGGNEEKVELPQEDAAALRLGGEAEVAGDISGAKSRNGNYVTRMNAVGSSATWSTRVPEEGKYTVFVRYSVPGEDANSTLTVNGDPHDKPLNMKNFAQAEKGDWEKSWTSTFAWVTLKEGANSIAISCGKGNECNFILDRVWLKSGWVEN